MNVGYIDRVAIRKHIGTKINDIIDQRCEVERGRINLFMPACAALWCCQISFFVSRVCGWVAKIFNALVNQP